MEQIPYNEMKPGLRRAIYELKRVAPLNFRLLIETCKGIATLAAMTLFFKTAVDASIYISREGGFLAWEGLLALMVLIYGIWVLGHFLTATLWPRTEELRKKKRRLYAEHARADRPETTQPQSANACRHRRLPAPPTGRNRHA